MAYKGPGIIDLFSGCGGFSLGAAMAGFTSLASVDVDPTLQSAYRLNFPLSKPVQADIAQLEGEWWRSFLGNVRPDGIIGGPPCQGFSRMGRREKNDPRNTLVGHFYRHVLMLRPKFFVMENVEGLLDGENGKILSSGIDMVSSKYQVVGPFVVDASTLGAPTTRRRVIVVGYDKSEMNALSESELTSPVVKKISVREAISDLPSPVSRLQRDDFGWAAYPKLDGRKLSAYAKKMRRLPTGNLGWSSAIEEVKSGRVSGLFSTKHTREVTKRFRKVKEGKSDAISRCPRLAWDGLCPTLRAGTGSDKGSFQSIRPIHPTEPRVITVREAARLQGFPDWFVFNPTKWHSFRMIGNSVSPVVSEALLSSVYGKLSR